MDGPDSAPFTFVFAHGAGAPMDSKFMDYMASGLACNDLQVIRFEFPYMSRQRLTGRRSVPDRVETLLRSFRQAVNHFSGEGKLVIGGKSMGGRIATLLACERQSERKIDACLCFGYPFHPLGKPNQLRIDHLKGLTIPLLIVQGERDPMGSKEDVCGYRLHNRIQLSWMPDGDHSFKPRKSSGLTELDNWKRAVDESDLFLRRHAD